MNNRRLAVHLVFALLLFMGSTPAYSGWTPDRGGEGGTKASHSVVLLEEAPDAGQVQLAEADAQGVFARYTMYQRRVRDSLNRELTRQGVSVKLLEDDPAFNRYAADDPVRVGVGFVDGTFAATPRFADVVRKRMPDAIALYYRIDWMAYDARRRTAEANVTLMLRHLRKRSVRVFGTKSVAVSVQNDRTLAADMALALERAVLAVLRTVDVREQVEQIGK